MSGSQFASLFKTDNKEKKEVVPRDKSAKKKPDASPPPKTAQAQPNANLQKRATGKSRNADYTQVLSYVKKDTHNRVKAALIFDDQQRDLSDLVEELLGEWLKNKK
jgi:hypothetical protein